MQSAGLEWAVTTWNLQGAKDTDLERVAEQIRSESPDAVALQEIRRPQAEELARILSMRTEWVEKHHLLRPFFTNWAEGAAILTPHKLSRGGHTTISKSNWKRTYRHRIVQWATIERPDASAYRLYNTHLSPHDRTTDRVHEARAIAALADEHGAAPPTIVAGDLNDHGEPEVIDALPGAEHLPPPPTNPSNAPTSPIDHVVLPVEARDVAVTVPAGGPQWNGVSDHLPVTVRFTIDWVKGDFAT